MNTYVLLHFKMKITSQLRQRLVALNKKLTMTVTSFYHHYIFIIYQLWLTSHRRSAEVLLDTGTLGTSREIYSEDADDGN